MTPDWQKIRELEEMLASRERELSGYRARAAEHSDNKIIAERVRHVQSQLTIGWPEAMAVVAKERAAELAKPEPLRTRVELVDEIDCPVHGIDECELNQCLVIGCEHTAAFCQHHAPERAKPEPLQPSSAELIADARSAFREFRAVLSSGERWNATDKALRDADVALVELEKRIGGGHG